MSLSLCPSLSSSTLPLTSPFSLFCVCVLFFLVRELEQESGDWVRQAKGNVHIHLKFYFIPSFHLDISLRILSSCCLLPETEKRKQNISNGMFSSLTHRKIENFLEALENCLEAATDTQHTCEKQTVFCFLPEVDIKVYCQISTVPNTAYTSTLSRSRIAQQIYIPLSLYKIWESNSQRQCGKD